MTKIIDGKNAILGRLSSYVAKEILKGEEMIVLNCGEVIITGNKKNIKEHFEQKRRRVGSGQQGPKYSKSNEKIVKRAIRGMLPNHRKGRGKIIFKLIKCYNNVPEEFEKSKKITFENKKTKFVKIKNIYSK
tara:strand:+ start:73221 stop:73616 length:396 start_codon:yes stop_codon:yes gene_type:complete